MHRVQSALIIKQREIPTQLTKYGGNCKISQLQLLITLAGSIKWAELAWHARFTLLDLRVWQLFIGLPAGSGMPMTNSVAREAYFYPLCLNLFMLLITEIVI